MFYQRGDDYLDCWNALNAPASKYIVNSHYLHAWFKDTYPQIYKNSVVFDPVFSRSASRIFPEKKAYNLFFYALLKIGSLIVLSLALALTGKTGGNGALGAEIWLAARVIYVPLYLAGVPFLRTLVWTASIIGLIMMLVKLLA